MNPAGEGPNGLGPGAGAVRGVCGRSAPAEGVERPDWSCGWKPAEGIAPRDSDRDVLGRPELRLMLRGRPPGWNTPIPMPVGCEPRGEGKGLFGLAERPVNGLGGRERPPFGAGTLMGCVVGGEANCKGREEFVLGACSWARSFQTGLPDCCGCCGCCCC